MFLNNFLIMTMTTHTANWLATRSATHGQRTTTAVTDSERESQRQRESLNFTENERESEAIKRAESAAPEFETAAPATMRMGEQSRVQNKAHTGHTPRGVNRQQRAERERVRVREQNLHRAAADTHTHTHTLTCRCLLC